MRSLVLIVILLAAGRADAMGFYAALDVVAWNADGTSALVSRAESGSAEAGASLAFILVTAGEKPLVVAFTNTRDPDHSTEHVDPKTCTRAAQSLNRALAANHFHGVAIHAERCSAKARDVVEIDVATAREAALSWVAAAHSRTPSPREVAATDAAKITLKDLPHEAGDVATLTGKLILVCWGINGDSSPLAHCVPMAQTKSGFDAEDDLRAAK